jgi:hypothetical protein
MKTPVLYFSLIFFIIFLTACPNNEIEQNPQIGEVITLNYEDSVTFYSNSGNVAVGFHNVISDNRLGDCTTAYGIFEAKIELTLRCNNDIFVIPITIPGCTVKDQNIYKDTLGYRVCVYRLEPFAVSSVNSNSDYKIKLKIDKQ